MLSALSALPLISFSYRTIPNDGGFVPWFATSTAWRMASNHWLVERLSVTSNWGPSKIKAGRGWLQDDVLSLREDSGDA
jgi:hypothetical protein